MNSSENLTLLPTRWGIALLGATLYFSFTYTWNSLAALIPIVAKDLSLSDLETGFVLGTVALTIFFTWPIVGPWVERVGAVRAMGIGVVVLGLAGMARGIVETLPTLVLTMIVVSLGGSTVTYGLPGIVASWFAPEKSGTPLGIVTVAATLGTVFSFDTMPTVVELMGGWRLALAASGIPAIVSGLIWLKMGSVGPHHDEDSESPSLTEIVHLLKRPEVFTLVLGGTMYLFATHSIYGWLSPLLIERGIETPTATRLVAIATTGMIVGGLVLPYFDDTTSEHSALVGASGLAFGISVAVLAIVPLDFRLLAILTFATGIAIGGISPLLRRLPLDMVSSGSISTVIGMVFGLGAIGGFVGPVLIGTARTWTGTNSIGFLILALPGLAFVGIAVRLRRE